MYAGDRGKGVEFVPPPLKFIMVAQHEKVG